MPMRDLSRQQTTRLDQLKRLSCDLHQLSTQLEAAVWQWTLTATSAEMAQAEAVLSPDEQARADRFHFSEHRTRYIIGRAMLRQLLGVYLNQAAERIRLTTNPHGKPTLVAPPFDVRFNLAHSEAVAVVAVTIGRTVGIDIERVDRTVDTVSISRHFFSANEQAALTALPPAAQRRAFFACWTRKEAYIKARGEGLSIPLSSFDVSVSGPARLLACRQHPDEVDRWQMESLAVGEGLAAALMVERLPSRSG